MGHSDTDSRVSFLGEGITETFASCWVQPLQHGSQASQRLDMATHITDLDGLIHAWAQYYVGGAGGSIISVGTENIEIVVTNFKYDTPSPLTTPISIITEQFSNGSTVEDSSVFKHTKTTKATFQWAISQGLKLGAKASFTVGLPAIDSAKVEASIDLAFGSTQTQSNEQAQQWEADQKINIPARSVIDASIVVQTATYDPNFSATITVSGTVDLKYTGGSNASPIWEIILGAQQGIYHSPTAKSLTVDPTAQNATFRASGTFKGVQGTSHGVTVVQHALPKSL